MRAGNKKNMGAVLKRLMAYILKKYKWQCLLVALCILVSTAANIGGTLFMRNLIDDYILPFVNRAQPDLTPLLRALLMMAAVYYVGVFCTWAYNFMMIYVSQGMLKTVRDDLFCHMERLPVRYFDTKSHGDIMSIYTNDTDTLRQVISQSMPQMLSAVITGLKPSTDNHHGGNDSLHGVCDENHIRKERALFCKAADRCWKSERIYRGNDGRAEGGKGVLP